MDFMSQENIKNLEKLDIRFQVDSLFVDVEWFRVLHSSEVPNREWHFHKNIEIHYLHEGCVTFYFEGDSVVLHPGQILVIGKNISHQLVNTSNERYLRFVMNINMTVINNDPEAAFIYSIFDFDNYIALDSSEHVRSLFISCLNESVNRVAGFLTIIKLNITRILWVIARLISENKLAPYIVDQKYSLNDRRSFNISDYIEKTPPSKLSVSAIAQYMNLSEKQVQRIVKRQFGTTIKHLICEVKLSKAKELLKDPLYTNGQISDLLGFANEQCFSRFFKQNEGMPPGVYRKSIEPSLSDQEI